MDRLNIGDRVAVGWADDKCLLSGTLVYMPVATGDSWIIRDDEGRPWYFQQFEFIRLDREC